MQVGNIHAALKPVSWLIGKWKSILAKGEYPSIQPFEYCEEIEFKSMGQPMLNYTTQTWHPVKLNPMHFETGFLRVKPGTNDIAFMVAHNFGITSLEEGSVCGEEVKLKSVHISRMSFAKAPAVTAIERIIKLRDGNLEITVLMATESTALKEHLIATYEKVSS